MMTDSNFELSSDVLFEEVGGEMVLLDLKSDNYFGLDEIGARIWTRLSEGDTPAQIVDLLHEEYEVERETLEADLGDLLKSLHEAGLISLPD